MNKNKSISHKVVIETAKHIMVGDIVMRDSFANQPGAENILLYALNCGNKFITLHNCSVTNKENPEFKPELIEDFHINLDIVHTCHLVKD